MYYCKTEPVLWKVEVNDKPLQTHEKHNLLSPDTYSPVFTSYATLCLSLALALELSLSLSLSLFAYISQPAVILCLTPMTNSL